ncbi:MAG: ribose-5-phosphate isomerase RpiA [Nitrospiraceae bacterium]
MTTPQDLDSLKHQAALKALEYVRDGMVVGLGTGSTAKHVVVGLGVRVRAGLKIRGVPTSLETAELARKNGIQLIEHEHHWAVDVAIDGADQVDPQLNLIKGGGGALLKEKIVASAARQFIVVVDYTKRVPGLGRSFPLPIEVVPFGWGNTAQQIEVLGGKAILRERNGQIVVTEAGHYILDLHVERIDRPAELEAQLARIPGVVESGLFVGRTTLLLVGTPHGIDVHKPSGS